MVMCCPAAATVENGDSVWCRRWAGHDGQHEAIWFARDRGQRRTAWLALVPPPDILDELEEMGRRD